MLAVDDQVPGAAVALDDHHRREKADAIDGVHDPLDVRRFALRWCEMTSSFALAGVEMGRALGGVPECQSAPSLRRWVDLRTLGHGRRTAPSRLRVSTALEGESGLRNGLTQTEPGMPLPRPAGRALNRNERRLSGVLGVVVDHAHEPDAERHGWIPRSSTMRSRSASVMPSTNRMVCVRTASYSRGARRPSPP